MGSKAPSWFGLLYAGKCQLDVCGVLDSPVRVVVAFGLDASQQCVRGSYPTFLSHVCCLTVWCNSAPGLCAAARA